MARTDKIWTKKTSIPIWVVQLIITLIFTASAGITLWAVDEVGEDYDLDDRVENLLNAAAAIQLAFSVFTIILIIIEIVLAATHRLGPVGNIIIQCIKSAIWTFFFAVEIRAIVLSAVTGWSIFLTLVMFVTCIGQLVYGSVIVHRHRKGTLYRGDYALANGGQVPSQFAPVPGQAFAYTQGVPAPSYPYSAETAYKPQAAPPDYYGPSAPNAYEMSAHPPRY